MPLVEGDTLRARLAREVQLPVNDAIRIAEQTASALDYAHCHGVVHRKTLSPRTCSCMTGGAGCASDRSSRAQPPSHWRLGRRRSAACGNSNVSRGWHARPSVSAALLHCGCRRHCRGGWPGMGTRTRILSSREYTPFRALHDRARFGHVAVWRAGDFSGRTNCRLRGRGARRDAALRSRHSTRCPHGRSRGPRTRRCPSFRLTAIGSRSTATSPQKDPARWPVAVRDRRDPSRRARWRCHVGTRRCDLLCAGARGHDSPSASTRGDTGSRSRRGLHVASPGPHSLPDQTALLVSVLEMGINVTRIGVLDLETGRVRDVAFTRWAPATWTVTWCT